MTATIPGRAGPRLEMCPIGDIDPAQWDDLISADSSSSAFHTREWLACLQAAYPRWEVGAIVARQSESIAAALPFVKRRVLGVVVVESLPFGGYGGVITADASFNAETLVERFLGEARTPVSVVRVVDISGRIPTRWKDAVTLRTSAIVDLSAGYHATAARYRANVRKNLRRARDSQLVVEGVVDQSSIRTFWELARYAYRRYSTAMPYRIELYEAVARLLVPTGRAMFQLAFKDGAAVAGSLHLIGAHEMFNWLTPAYRDFQDLRANTLLIDNAIRFGVEAGLDTYNLGASQGSEGLQRFKSSWGGYEKEYSVFERMSRPVALASHLRAIFRRTESVTT